MTPTNLLQPNPSLKQDPTSLQRETTAISSSLETFKHYIFTLTFYVNTFEQTLLQFKIIENGKNRGFLNFLFLCLFICFIYLQQNNVPQCCLHYHFYEAISISQVLHGLLLIQKANSHIQFDVSSHVMDMNSSCRDNAMKPNSQLLKLKMLNN